MAFVEAFQSFLGMVRNRLTISRGSKKHWSWKRASLGQSLLIIAVAFFSIIAFVGFVIDTGIIYLHRVWLGQAVDAASLAAGYELPNIKGACARAVEYLQANGYNPGLDFTFQIIYPSRPDAPNPPGDPGEFVIDSVASAIDDPSDCASVSVPAIHNDIHYEVGVSATQKVPVIFMHVLGFDQVSVAAPSVSERSARFDVVLVLDRSGSMKFDTCSVLRPADEYGCQNRYNPCTVIYSEDFEAYDTIEEVQAAGWVVNSGVKLMKTGGDRSIELRRRDTVRGEIYRTISTEGYRNVALFLKARNVNLATSDEMIISYRQNPGHGWSQIVRYSSRDMPRELVGYAVMLPSVADDNPALQIRITTTIPDPKRLEIDDIELRTCSDTAGPWVWYKADYNTGCRNDRPMTCAGDDWDTLLPGVSIAGDSPPMANLMEEPMLDVLLAADAFIDILDSRHLPTQPREDQIGLVAFESVADKLHDLTTDYETIKHDLFTRIRAYGGTNLGGAMRLGLSVLRDGRVNSKHYVVLLTDGWPNFYDLPYLNPTAIGRQCPTNDPCREALEYVDAQIAEANNQNVVIFAIGLGEDLNTRTFTVSNVRGWTDGAYSGMDLLDRIASRTGGVAYHSPSTEELDQIFAWIAQAIFIRLTQ